MTCTSLRFYSLFALGLLVPAPGCSDPCVDDGVSAGNCDADNGISAGTDTASSSSSSSSSSSESGTLLLLCQDADSDTFGNPATCQEFAVLTPGWVLDNTDCDDTDVTTFPGAAPNDGTFCAKDSDNDDWGDDQPKVGVTPGTDCKDSDPAIHSGASCFPTLTVSAGPDQIIDAGTNATLNAEVEGGSGEYAFSWTPSASLSSTDTAQTSATPSETTIYTVTVTDAVTGLRAHDEVAVGLSNIEVDLEDACEVWDLGTQNEALDPAIWTYSEGGHSACQMTNNNSSALWCSGKGFMRITGTLWVPAFAGGPDNDWIGLLWNVSSERTEYNVFDWKKEPQIHDFCGPTEYQPGMRIKHVSLPTNDTILTCDDLAGEFETTHSTLLKRATEIEGGTTPWVTGEHYTFDLHFVDGGTELTIQDSTGAPVAATSVESTGLAGGDFGLFGFSQDRFCFANVVGNSTR